MESINIGRMVLIVYRVTMLTGRIGIIICIKIFFIIFIFIKIFCFIIIIIKLFVIVGCIVVVVSVGVIVFTLVVDIVFFIAIVGGCVGDGIIVVMVCGSVG